MSMLARLWHSARLAWAVLAAAVLVYPLAVLAGGGPHFPSRRDCARPATQDGEITLVLGSFASATRAAPFLAQARREGYGQARAGSDGCGGVEVSVPGYTTLAGAEDAVREARRAGFPARLDQG